MNSKRYVLAGLTASALVALATAAVWTVHVQRADAHCQMPCGIYDDAARVAQLREAATTIAKAIDQIQILAAKHDAESFNQAARWVTTKEAHASQVIEVVADYFLTQRVKPVAPGADGYEAYLKTLADHHAVMVAAMKTKQEVSPAAVEALNKAIDALAAHYK
jgi:nickel superoxide dismutase